MFTNLSNAQQVSSILLSHFGKHTNVLMEIHGHTINVRRAHDNALIAKLYVTVSFLNAEFQVMMVTPEEWVTEDVYNALPMKLMSLPRFPRLYKRDKRWSPIKNKIIEGAY